MRRITILTAVFILALSIVNKNFAQNNSVCSRSYICYRSAQPLSIDGKLDEESWQKAMWSEEFVDIEGDAKPDPLYPTQMKMLWDDEYLYIAATLNEPHLWATITERDAVIFQDNDFEVFIDPDGDTHQYYELEVNALNTIWDLRLVKPYRDGGPPLNEWDIKGIKTAVELNGTLNNPKDEDKSWTVEMALPWEALKEYAYQQRKPIDKEQWRINFSRVEWRLKTKKGEYSKEIDPKTKKSYPEYNWVWAPQGLINMHYPESWGYMQFSSRQVGEGDVEFVCKPEEEVKWYLRELYYKQRAFKEEKQSYSDNLIELNSQEPPPAYSLYDCRIDLTNNGYEITAEFDEKWWKIDQTGKVWSIAAR